MLTLNLWIAILILSVKAGAIFGSSWLRTRHISIWAVILGGTVVALSWTIQGSYQGMALLIDKYTFPFSCMAGLLLIYLGLDHNHAEGLKVGNRMMKIRQYLSFLPCPFCVGALVVSVVYTAGASKLPLMMVATVAGFVFTLCIVLMSWMLRKFSGWFNFSLVHFFNQFLLFLGVFTLLSAFLIPTIVATMKDTFIPMVICTREDFLKASVGFLTLFVLGAAKEMLRGLKVLYKFKEMIKK